MLAPATVDITLMDLATLEVLVFLIGVRLLTWNDRRERSKMAENKGSAPKKASGGETLKIPPPLTDTEFAVAVDARLWVSPSGNMRNNTENYRAIDDLLKELDDARKVLQDLLERLIRFCQHSFTV